MGHAVLTARDAVEDEPFVVILPDDIIDHRPGVISQMLAVSNRYNGGVIAVEQVPWEIIHNYGVVDSDDRGDRTHFVKGLVEKPAREDAPSNLSIVGRYILPPEIFDCLETDRPPAPGVKSSLPTVSNCCWKGGTSSPTNSWEPGTTAARPLGLLRASLEYGLAREDTRDAVSGLISGLASRQAEC